LQRKHGFVGTTASKDLFRTIAVANIPFHLYTDGQPHQMNLPFGWCVSQTAYITVVLTGTGTIGGGKVSLYDVIMS